MQPMLVELDFAFPERINQKIMLWSRTGLLIGSIGLALSLISFVAWGFPWELISHFRLQYWTASLLLCGFSFGWRRSRQQKYILWLSLLLIGINTIALLPWYLPHAQQTTATSNLRILSANVNIRNDRYASAIAMVQQQHPDIALFIEVNDEWINQLNTGLKEQMPYHFGLAANGLAVWSRMPLQNIRGDSLGSDDYSLLATIPVGVRSPKGAAAPAVQFIGTHLMVPFRRNLFERRNRQLNGLSQAIQNRSEPTIVMGDFNLTPWSPYYAQLIQQTRLHNAQLGFGIHPTYPQASTLTKFPSWIAPLLQMPIDHALVSSEIQVNNFYTVVNGNADHAAIVADFVVPW
jgi:endonuclease/exonuclease/phosphatase (EEP) superfamily protein YafD